ncbi:unnamed protein product [Meganyctiphanes norvegica]|uniref:DNA-directed RNA polymerase III subunit n=1 Tax=Meganyctiphanes norvegica TaxID=48144 RepID=A0AAV2Q5W1_MEGNR
MGGRGRGGGGRGRGKNLEQLGVQKGEALPERVVGPPETFPPLEFRPVKPPQEKNIAESYLLVIKKEFREHMQNSQYHIQPDVTRPDIERYSDRYNMLPNRRGQLNLHWTQFPKELRPGAIKTNKKRKITSKKAFPVNVKRGRMSQKEVDVTQTLNELEKKESTTDDPDEVEEDEEEEGKVDEENIEGDEEDEELDDGTDYVNNYFDNGEELDEEDDALEEGGTF